MPTVYPKCSPTEMLGLLVLLNGHKGSEDVALLADDLDLEIDEIFPALEYAELLQLVKVEDGRATFTELGRKLVGASIRERKTILREQLKKTALFRTILRALEGSEHHRLSDEELGHIVSFTTARADDAEQNIVNWGRYADLFRYDADEHALIALRKPSGSSKPGGGRAPPPSSGPEPATAAAAAPSGNASKPTDPPTGVRPAVVTA